ncbi:uncharacterized protein TRIADDRAFT_54792 [Trichoplax adhaerens]|uniref:Calcyphosin-2 PH domain-containing protein n=1 Tax=Trichoplax adhaerens TaxID=10228 RepID=B3RT06_TRIAD|nr:hypothetical protein TRIADDRAFT_54792 [Trichoplax adhaerens]EDV27141.1 hypothetical protein TRIADDRAFT_54792 [Trichoplax adhaerens]|eukprot:XP_002111137.1 hypothetical protein TRIADDRAFT_54792 [Trichoplax adhaerens]
MSLDLTVHGKSSRIENSPRQRSAKSREQRFGVADLLGGSNQNLPQSPGHQPSQKAGVITKSALEATKREIGVSTKDQVNPARDVTQDNDQKGIQKKTPFGVPPLELGNLAQGDDRSHQLLSQSTYDTSDTTSNVSWGRPLSSKRPQPTGRGGGWRVNDARKEAEEKKLLEEKLVYNRTDTFDKPEDIPALKLPDTYREGFVQKVDIQEKNIHAQEPDAVGKTTGKLVSRSLRQAQRKLESLESLSQMTPEEIKRIEAAEEAVLEHLKKIDISARVASKITDNSSEAFRSRRHLISNSTNSDALKELDGFYFIDDGSLAIYEYHQIGSRSTALPLIQRDIYNHFYGLKQGKRISLQDIQTGNNLIFETNNKTTLPKSLSAKKFLILRITNVDEDARDAALVKESVKEDVENDIHAANLLAIQDSIRKEIKRRGIKTVIGLGQYLRTLDRQSTSTLDKNQFKLALKRYHIDITDKDFEILWYEVDIEKSTHADYSFFMQLLVGEIGEAKHSLIRKAFRKLDSSKQGVVNIFEIKKFYTFPTNMLTNIPDYISPHTDAVQFIESFGDSIVHGRVYFWDFLLYYIGLAFGLDDDIFYAVIKKSWRL